MVVDIAREKALKILYEINEKGAYSNISINKWLDNSELRGIDKAFITELVYGTIKWRLTIDWVIGQYSSIRMKKLSPWILNIVRLGVYQLLYTDRIPESAACNESVKLARRYGHQASVGFVNGILRSIARNRPDIRYPDREKEPVQYLSVRYSHPEWMVKEWLDRFEYAFVESLLDSNNGIPDFTLRTNTLKIARDQLIRELNRMRMEAVPGRYIDESIILKNPTSFTQLELFKNGYFQVQDESSMLVARILDPKPGEMVMDVCSAPGGKATHIAQLMGNKGRVLARDIHEHKIKIIREAAERLGLDIIETELFDATRVDERYAGKADRVLVDAPCTGLGILRRKPDIKWARNLEDRSEITKLQLRILTAASSYVKPGGILVYSTCTIEREENEETIEAFTRENKDFQLVDISSLLPDKLIDRVKLTGCIQLFPNVDNIDGFFIAKLQKK